MRIGQHKKKVKAEKRNRMLKDLINMESKVNQGKKMEILKI